MIANPAMNLNLIAARFSARRINNDHTQLDGQAMKSLQL